MLWWWCGVTVTAVSKLWSPSPGMRRKSTSTGKPPKEHPADGQDQPTHLQDQQGTVVLAPCVVSVRAPRSSTVICGPAPGLESKPHVAGLYSQPAANTTRPSLGAGPAPDRPLSFVLTASLVNDKGLLVL